MNCTTEKKMHRIKFTAYVQVNVYFRSYHIYKNIFENIGRLKRKKKCHCNYCSRIIFDVFRAPRTNFGQLKTGHGNSLSMTSSEYSYFVPQYIKKRFYQHAMKKHKSRQEICAFLKWLCFFINFIVFPLGVTFLALGVYLCVKDPRAVTEWADVFMNPAIMLIAIGLAICTISLIGSMGALRDNIFLLKSFALSVFFCYILLVLSTFMIFILFYSDTIDGISANSILFYSVKNYHKNRNIADFIDYVQEQFECCGVSSASQGYRDWQLSHQFNCSVANPYPERCGVPFSCCRRSVISEAVGSKNPLLPSMRSLECWQNAQNKRPQEAEASLHTRGCLQPLKSLFENNAVYIGSFVAIVIVPCITICLSNILARQIDHQHYLLEREAQRCARRRRREMQKFRDAIAVRNCIERVGKSNINNSPANDFDNKPVTFLRFIFDSFSFLMHQIINWELLH
ncbi:unnamed protein product [Dracunculus medinensis]|uniref:Tetraspanin n=1 Tax=Dracunculus medinensis TaxID=318479 RepID=A0A158Q5A6_DRAME|nr:unnamed protein product [Dracunculus medinensis]